MKTHSLTTTMRTITGKKVKNLRKSGMLPATIYGKTIKSVSVSVIREDFEKVFAKAGETGIVELTVDKEKRPVLIHMVQRDAVTNFPIHIEFHQVDLKEKVHAKIPLSIVGESPAVKEHLGVLLTVLDEVEVEALPTDLPEHIIVDVSSLAEVDQELKVSNLVFSADVTVLTDKELTVVKVGSLVTKEAEAQAAEEAAAKAAAATPAEGEVPVTEKTEEAPVPTAEPKKTP